MSDKFKAIILNESGKEFSREIKTLDKSFFKTGDVLVKVDYSGLNYKDALILNNGGKLVKDFPQAIRACKDSSYNLYETLKIPGFSILPGSETKLLHGLQMELMVLFQQ